MEVILLERVGKLGQMGEVVRVKDGFARNFLLRRGKALRATDENRTRFETMKGDLQVRSAGLKTEASGVADKLNGRSFTVLRQASESGQLFGSVSPRDIVSLVNEAGFAVSRNQVALNAPIKTIGQHAVSISLHPEIDTTIKVIVARNADEAARIARGEMDLMTPGLEAHLWATTLAKLAVDQPTYGGYRAALAEREGK